MRLVYRCLFLCKAIHTPAREQLYSRLTIRIPAEHFRLLSHAVDCMPFHMMMDCLQSHQTNPLPSTSATIVHLPRYGEWYYPTTVTTAWRDLPLDGRSATQLQWLFSTIRPIELDMRVYLRSALLGESIRSIDASRLASLRLRGTLWAYHESVSEDVLAVIGFIIAASAPTLRELDFDCHGEIGGPSMQDLAFPKLAKLAVSGQCIAAGDFMEDFLSRCKHVESLAMHSCCESPHHICTGLVTKAARIRTELLTQNAESLRYLRIPSREPQHPELITCRDLQMPELLSISMDDYEAGFLELLPATVETLTITTIRSSTLMQLTGDLRSKQLRNRLPKLACLQMTSYIGEDIETDDAPSVNGLYKDLQSVCDDLGVALAWE